MQNDSGKEEEALKKILEENITFRDVLEEPHPNEMPDRHFRFMEACSENTRLRSRLDLPHPDELPDGTRSGDVVMDFIDTSDDEDEHELCPSCLVKKLQKELENLKKENDEIIEEYECYKSTTDSSIGELHGEIDELLNPKDDTKKNEKKEKFSCLYCSSSEFGGMLPDGSECSDCVKTHYDFFEPDKDEYFALEKKVQKLEDELEKAKKKPTGLKGGSSEGEGICQEVVNAMIGEASFEGAIAEAEAKQQKRNDEAIEMSMELTARLMTQIEDEKDKVADLEKEKEDHIETITALKHAIGFEELVSSDDDGLWEKSRFIRDDDVRKDLSRKDVDERMNEHKTELERLCHIVECLKNVYGEYDEEVLQTEDYWHENIRDRGYELVDEDEVEDLRRDATRCEELEEIVEEAGGQTMLKAMGEHLKLREDKMESFYEERKKVAEEKAGVKLKEAEEKLRLLTREVNDVIEGGV